MENTLKQIYELCVKNKWHDADKMLNVLYEKYTTGIIQLNKNDEDQMFLLMSKISKYLYG